MSSNHRGQSRWSDPHDARMLEGSPANNESAGRDRSQSWNRGRGYETHHERHEPSNTLRDSRDRDGDRSRKGGDFRAGGGGGGGGGRRDDYYRNDNGDAGRDGRGERWGDRRENWDGNRHPDRFDRRRDDGLWRCLECGDNNDPRDDRCARCRYWRSERKHERHRDDRGRGDYYGPRGEGNCDDDRNAGSRKKIRSSSSKNDKPIRREWPPAFDASGAQYIFDARSGFFYEPASDFFYDPKTKFYYSNKKQQYFQFVADASPPFQPVGNQTQANGTESAPSNGPKAEVKGEQPDAKETEILTPDADPNETKNEKVESKSKIAICLKTTALPQKKSGVLNEAATIEKNKLKEKSIKKRESSLSTTDAVPAIPQSHKAHEKDMDKWSERVKEMKGNDGSNSITPATDTSVHAQKITRTASGQPICVLCKRKFANLDKLRVHEKHSALHKENLAKKAAADVKESKKEESPPEATYRDRTKERRMLYGDFGTHSTTGDSHADALLAQVEQGRSGGGTTPSEAVRPEEALGNTNVGNKLLQKLGWKDGDLLGRKQSEEVNQSVEEKGDVSKGRDVVANSLKSDWERIEALAQGGGRNQQYR